MDDNIHIPPQVAVPDLQELGESPMACRAEARPGGTAPVDALGDEASDPAATEPGLPCEFTCGVAGSGKTYLWRERIAANPADGILAATTGIAAINLNTVTLNSLLRYFDTASLRDAYLNGSLIRRLRELREGYRRLVIDEVSMMDGEQLSILVRAALECNTFLSPRRAPPLGITLVGDFAQLPPVRARWAFESDEWHRFEAHTTRLTKVWRQDSGAFLNALNFCRSGNGATSADILSSEGLEWHSALEIGFDGTTIVPKNDAVSRYNAEALSRLSGRAFEVASTRWGKQRSEWSQNRRTMEWGIPPRIALKLNAYVMLLANAYDENRNLIFANGDCGHIVEYDGRVIRVQLVRNSQVVEVSPIVRATGASAKPEGWDGSIGDGEYLPHPYWHPERKTFVEGQVRYFPLRLAYASSVHKSQGLSLDRCQIDIRDRFFAAPAMEYVALSRCRTLPGLRIVGQRERYVKHCNIDERVRPWL